MISVIIPTYNRPIQLQRAIRSVLNQVNVKLELLVINDSSDDLSIHNIINKFADDRIRFYKNERTKGGNGARNTGIIHSKGDFIAFLDDDDEWQCSKLEKQLNLLNSLDDSFAGVYCGYELEMNKRWVKFLVNQNGKLLYELLINKVVINSGSTLLIRKKAIEKIGFFDEKLQRHQDLEFLVRFFRHYQIECVREVLVKIYGHNIPKDEKVYEIAKLTFLEKIQADINLLPIKYQNSIYAHQYRELALTYAMHGNKKKICYYIHKSISYKLLFPTRYLSTIFYIIRNTIGIDFIKLLDEIKFSLLKNQFTSNWIKKII